MFKASEGYVLVGSDYSQQEPRILTAYSNDEKLLDAYNQGKDMYATMGMGVYNNDYWDNTEFYKITAFNNGDGTISYIYVITSEEYQ